jgi:hypothetical protein
VVSFRSIVLAGDENVFRVKHPVASEKRFKLELHNGSAVCPINQGVDVMIAIFGDFYPFSAKKLAFFSKTNDMITIFAKTSFVLRQIHQYFH